MLETSAGVSMTELVPVACGGWDVSAMHCKNCHLGWDIPTRNCMLKASRGNLKHSVYIFGDKGEEQKCNPRVLLHHRLFCFYRMQCARRLSQLVNLLTVS